MAIEIKLPSLGENIDSATVVRVLVKVGEKIDKDKPILELDTEKASVDVPAPSSGTVKEIQVKEGDVINVGQTVMILEDEGANKVESKTPPQEATPAPPPLPATPPPQHDEPKPTEPSPPPPSLELLKSEVSAAPSLRRMARELGVDINAVAGTGSDGRITEEDVRNHARTVISNASQSVVRIAATPLPDFSRWGQVERKPLSSIRRAIAEHVQEAWSSIPHVTQFDTADITELEAFRKTLETKVTITAIALKVVAAALETFPHFNVSLDPDRGEVISKKYCHIGVAVDTEHGLLVPVIRDVDKKGILELSVEVAQAAEKARSRKLSIEDMQGGTFTITNLGGIGGVNFTPIVNSPEVAILGMSRGSLQPVFRDGEFRPRLILPLALSYDHRAVDGADGARFLRWVAEAFEQPLRLAL